MDLEKLIEAVRLCGSTPEANSANSVHIGPEGI